MRVSATVLVLLAAVVGSRFAARWTTPWVPLPLLQVGCGAVLGAAFGLRLHLEPQLFLLLFIPPLLYLDGWRIPKGVFFREWRVILALAVGLVVFTMIGVGMVLHWLMPGVPLALAFAIAAIVGPTDPVAVTAITENAPLPSRLMDILEGEALLNDATGLVCFTFAVTAVTTGRFSPLSASGSFALVACGGLVVGAATVWIISRTNRLLVSRTGEEPAVQILVSLLMPFAAYLLAEELHVSGFLSAAAAGIAMHHGELSGRELPATRLQRNAAWDTIQVTLSGLIFLLLGTQMPAILALVERAQVQSGAGTPWKLVLYLLLVSGTLLVLRGLWAFVSISLSGFGRRSSGPVALNAKVRLAATTAAAGVRGAVTLAGVSTLPILLADGRSFPARDLAIFLAMGVILLSLVLASWALPRLARGLTESALPSHLMGERAARLAATDAAARYLQTEWASAPHDPDGVRTRSLAALRLLEHYRSRLESAARPDTRSPSDAALATETRSLRIEAIRAQREELYRLRRERAIDDQLHSRLVHELDLEEASLLQREGKQNS